MSNLNMHRFRLRTVVILLHTFAGVLYIERKYFDCVEFSVFIYLNMPQLTPRRRSRAVTMLENGWSARAVAREFNVSHTCINKLKLKWDVEHSVDRRIGSGRPRVTNVEDDENLLTYVREHPFTNSRTAVAETGFAGTSRTARRRLNEAGLQNRTAAVKEILTPRHCQVREEFAQTYLLQGNQFWQNVVFSDEKTFQSTKSGAVKVYRPINTRFSSEYVCERARSGRFSVHAWAWMSYFGPGVIWQIEGNLTGIQYCNILSDVMVPSVETVYPNGFIYQHDNSSIHTSAVVRRWITNNNLNVFPWPARSPDLNPMENLWAYLKRQLEGYDALPRNREELWARVEQEWSDISINYCQNLINSMPRRLQSIVEHRGKWTGY